MREIIDVSTHRREELVLGEDSRNRIVEVVVFTAQALVMREARSATAPGLNRFLLELQALHVDPDSAQARVMGHGELLSVQYKEIPVRKMPQQAIRELDETRRRLKRRRRSLENRKEILGKQRAFLDSVVAFSQTEIPKEVRTHFPEAGRLGEMIEFLDDRYGRLAETDEDLARQLEELDDELAVIERQLKQHRRPADATCKVIEVLFQSTTEQEVAIEASYMVRNAHWQPFYKVDVARDLDRIAMTMLARIEQQSGEHWKGVTLSVSNAVPLRDAHLPEPHSWYLRLAAPHPPLARSAVAAMTAPMGASEGLSDDALEELVVAVAAPEAEYRPAVASELPLAFEYRLPQQQDLTSGGGHALLPLYNRELDGEFFYQAVPRMDPMTYLVCRTRGDRALLAGRLNVHFGGRFVAGTELPEKQAGEELLLNLGADRGVRVQRAKLKDKLTETFFGKVDRSSVARELAFRIVVENLKDEAVRVRLLDSVPVSRTDRVQVKGIELQPPPTEQDWCQRAGVMLWDLTLGPRSEQEIRVAFYVKHPKDMPPSGL